MKPSCDTPVPHTYEVFILPFPVQIRIVGTQTHARALVKITLKDFSVQATASIEIGHPRVALKPQVLCVKSVQSNIAESTGRR